MEMMAGISQFWNTALGRASGSIVFAALAYIALKYILPLTTRRTRYEIDDIVIGVLRWPLPTIVFFSIMMTALPLLGLSEKSVYILTRVFIVLLIIGSSYLLLRLISQIGVRYAEEHAKQTESNLDDVLVPLITRRVIPLLILVITVICVLWAVGINLGGVFAGLGAVSFLLIFLFQEPLSNLFSGVYLVLDVPFKYGDLIILEDEKTYRVEEIGTRVTKLYNTDDHTVAFIPNNKLAGQRLINLTRPNVELRVKMQIGIAYGTENLARAQEILTEAANTHPHVLGDVDIKLKAMTSKMGNTSDESARIRLTMEMERLQVESSVRGLCENLIRQLEFLAQFVHRLERGGLDIKERENIQVAFDRIWLLVSDMRRKLTVWVHLIARLDMIYKLVGTPIGISEPAIHKRLPSVDQLELWRKEASRPDEIRAQLLENDNLAVIGTFSEIDEEFYLAGSIPWLDFSKEIDSQGVKASTSKILENWMREMQTWGTFKDFYELYQSWHKPVRDLLHSLGACSQVKRLRGEGEFRLDEQLHKVIKLLEERFPLQIPGWQQPDADFIGFGASSIDFQLGFFVDDLVREHFERMNDVFSEVGLDIMKKFREEHIEIPFPQMDIWFRDKWVKHTLRNISGRNR